MKLLWLCLIIQLGNSALFAASIDQVWAALDGQWKREMMEMEVSTDPRADGNTLLSIPSYDQQIIFKKDYSEVKFFILKNGGWQLTGNVADMVKHVGVKYILFARSNKKYDPGLWNNSINREKSFYDYIVLKEESGKRKIYSSGKLVGVVPGSRKVGLRWKSIGSELEVITNGSSAVPVVYRSLKIK